MSVVYHTSAENFSRDVLSSPVPVLVDFYADWCGPCRMLAPTLDKLAVEFSGTLASSKSMSTKNLNWQLGIRSAPSRLWCSSPMVTLSLNRRGLRRKWLFVVR